MAKRSRRDVSTPHYTTRRYSNAVPRYTVFRPSTYKPPNLSLIEDRRTYHPDPIRRVAYLSVNKPARLTLRENTRYNAPSFTKALVAFAEPKKLALCVRRSQRKQVLFAKGIGGSKRPQRRPRKNEFSDISCR